MPNVYQALSDDGSTIQVTEETFEAALGLFKCTYLKAPIVEFKFLRASRIEDPTERFIENKADWRTKALAVEDIVEDK